MSSLCISIAKNLFDNNYSIQFNDGENILGKSYPYPDFPFNFTPYPAVEIPLKDLEEYRDFIDAIIKRHKERK